MLRWGGAIGAIPAQQFAVAGGPLRTFEEVRCHRAIQAVLDGRGMVGQHGVAGEDRSVHTLTQ
ncbi:hypothetical protein D5S18_21365 [Nocardia panacis]|uniref:Uncharacterized protein n=1 Tax=Nocardia panacis TaxID=2340916 RepID=A0A3A4KHG2_9NOCA|nr:hypothetical protein D5S18_21365 [Nocardia panacis]